MLTCKQLTELVTAFLERELSWWDRIRFQLHVGMCHHCREYLRQMRRTVKVIGQLPAEPIPDDVRDELMHRFRQWKSSKSSGPES